VGLGEGVEEGGEVDGSGDAQGLEGWGEKQKEGSDFIGGVGWDVRVAAERIEESEIDEPQSQVGQVLEG